MTCPECQIAYDPHHWDACPHCGCEHELSGSLELLGDFRGVMRTSMVLIAAGDGEPVFYRSVEEVPEPLRRKLAASTNGNNSGTIYIADQGGRAEMSRAFASLSAAQADPLLPQTRKKRRISLAALWFALVMASFSGIVIWLVGSRSW